MEENRYIEVLLKKPNRHPKKVTIENSLEAMQRLVGGNIEVVQLYDALLVCNEEGKLKGLEPNVVIGDDTICGSFFIAGDDYENADFISISKKQYLVKEFIYCNIFYNIQPLFFCSYIRRFKV